MATKAREQQSMSAKSGSIEAGMNPKLAPGIASPMPSWQLVTKRVIDILIPVLFAPIVVPVCVLAAIAIKLDSAGPVFFRQTRIGQNGKPFTLFKFRSMHKDAERMRKELERLNEASGPIFKIRKDPRITRVGRILRKTSLDELPQLINVIRGEMSLVGPRPPLPEEVEKYNAYQMGRLAVKPGLTCLWQIQGRSSISFDKWVELDLEYIRNQSLWLDLKILLKTLPAVLKGTGAW